jgi:amidohydrolase
MIETLNTLLPNLEILRKEIHQNPELSEFEFETAKRISKFLKEETNATIKTVAKTGVLAIFDSGKKGPEIMLRADTDALPIVETNDFSHKSKTNGVSHKCGHDGHTVIMLGVAKMLSENPIEKGKVVLLFQPAEENGMGAEGVINDSNFFTFNFDYVFALHNIPGYPKHQIVVKENVFNANVKSMIIHFKGKTAHAAEPEKGHNPSLALAEILQFAEKITHNKPQDNDFYLITPIHMNMGELAYGISAGDAELHLTIRSWDLKLFDQKTELLKQFIEEICVKYHLQSDISWTQIFFANVNNSEANSFICKAAKTNGFDLFEKTDPFKWGEDFGLFTQEFNGAMFGLGAGEDTPALHNPDYDFPDEITKTGIHQFYQIIQEIVQK